jgi:hypothetical protein
MIELVHLAKTGGPLTKRISLAPDGSLLSDGSACTMASGRGWRITCATMQEFADGISGLSSDQAIALGALRSDLPDEVKITTKSHLEKLNGSANNLMARTSDHILYRAGQPALALIDIDCKGMPPAVRDRIKEAGGFWGALVSVCPSWQGQRARCAGPPALASATPTLASNCRARMAHISICRRRMAPT